MFSKITEIIKDLFIKEYNNDFSEIIKENLEYFKKLNLIELLNEVMPNKLFFDSKFKPNIKYNKVKDENYILNLKKYIEFDYKNEHNRLEEYNLFELIEILKHKKKIKRRQKC